MSTVTWVLVIVITVPLAWWSLGGSTAFGMGNRAAGVEELAKRRVRYEHRPPGFFEECVDWANKVADLPPAKRPVVRDAEFNGALERLAEAVLRWQTLPTDPMFDQHGAEANRYRKLFEKYPLREPA